MTATQARKNFFTLLETAEKPGMTVTITHEGHPAVVVMSLEEFEGWQETLEIMSDSQLMEDIREAIRESKTISLEDLERKVHAVQHVRSRAQRKGGKTIRQSFKKRSTKSTRRIARSS